MTTVLSTLRRLPRWPLWGAAPLAVVALTVSGIDLLQAASEVRVATQANSSDRLGADSKVSVSQRQAAGSL